MNGKLFFAVLLASQVTVGLSMCADAQGAEPTNKATATVISTTSGEVIGEFAKESGIKVAQGVSVVSHATSDTLDGFTWGGCSLARWAIGGRVDRSPNIGNLIVGLVFRLPVAAIGASVCASTAIVSMPFKGIGYAFDSFVQKKDEKN